VDKGSRSTKSVGITVGVASDKLASKGPECVGGGGGGGGGGGDARRNMKKKHVGKVGVRHWRAREPQSSPGRT
jgi:hypothetical protein